MTDVNNNWCVKSNSMTSIPSKLVFMGQLRSLEKTMADMISHEQTLQ